MMSSGDKRLIRRKVTKMIVHRNKKNFHSFSSLDQIPAIHGLLKRIIVQIRSLKGTARISKACF
jgi:hypothetical protein